MIYRIRKFIRRLRGYPETISMAMRIGITKSKPARGILVRQYSDGTAEACALGAINIGVGDYSGSYLKVADIYPELFDRRDLIGNGNKAVLQQEIIFANDSLHWSREHIANELEALGY